MLVLAMEFSRGPRARTSGRPRRHRHSPGVRQGRLQRGQRPRKTEQRARPAGGRPPEVFTCEGDRCPADRLASGQLGVTGPEWPGV
jgi:hypothetical protein